MLVSFIGCILYKHMAAGGSPTRILTRCAVFLLTHEEVWAYVGHGNGHIHQQDLEHVDHLPPAILQMKMYIGTTSQTKKEDKVWVCARLPGWEVR